MCAHHYAVHYQGVYITTRFIMHVQLSIASSIKISITSKGDAWRHPSCAPPLSDVLRRKVDAGVLKKCLQRA